MAVILAVSSASGSVAENTPIIGNPARSTTVFLPPESGAVDVTKPPYLADPTGRRDSTEALRHAMLDAGRRTPGIFTATDRAVQIVFLPNGIYRVSGPLCFDNAEILAARPQSSSIYKRNYVSGHMMLWGESREGTIIRLDDHCPAFQKAPTTVVRMTSAKGSNQAYFNSVVNLTIDVGQGNPSASALWFISSNLGTVRNVTLRAGPNTEAGAVGLDLTGQIGGLGYIRDLKVEGFGFGIRVGNFHPAYTFENIELAHQRTAGIETTDKSLQVRRLYSVNRVPALINRTPCGQAVLLDSVLIGGASNAYAVVNDGQLFARNVKSDGYRGVLLDHGHVAGGPNLTEWVSGKRFTLWDDIPVRSLGLEIRDTPDVPLGDSSTWLIFDPRKQADNTQALQAAIDSGAETIFIKGDRGRLRLTNTIVLRGNLRRLHGGWCNLDVENPAKDGRPLFRIETGRHPVTVLEAFSNGQRVHAFTEIENASDNTVVLRDLFLGYGTANYRNTGPGDVFLESVVSGGGDYDNEGMHPVEGWFIRGQRIWARNFNPEAYSPNLAITDGGQFWCLGFKFGEIYGPYLEVRRGARAELLGGVFNTGASENWRPERKEWTVCVEDAALALVAVDRLRPKAGEGPNPIMLVETRNGVTHKLMHDQFPRRYLDYTPGGKEAASVVIPLFRSAIPQQGGKE